MYSLSRRVVNGAVSPFPTRQITTLKPFSHFSNLRNSKTLPVPKLRISSSLNPSFPPSIVNNKGISTSLITVLVEKSASIPSVFIVITAYVLFRLVLKRIRKIRVLREVRSNFKVGDHIITTVDGERIEGEVENIGWLGTRVKLKDGKLFYISNGKLYDSGSVEIQIRSAPWQFSKDPKFESLEFLKLRQDDITMLVRISLCFCLFSFDSQIPKIPKGIQSLDQFVLPLIISQLLQIVPTGTQH
ncbi:hypothetical protein MKW94_004615 [Papaver nudicaule]|uniref:Mechanosensitive ion channel MscS domain-containing protein n=1 Tax=Papaver nudicaule TaxID=74823 RepID=A0AA41VD52_PAPNU|nr:hypothetical protein [Papaver nudicaule]